MSGFLAVQDREVFSFDHFDKVFFNLLDIIAIYCYNIKRYKV